MPKIRRFADFWETIFVLKFKNRFDFPFNSNQKHQKQKLLERFFFVLAPKEPSLVSPQNLSHYLYPPWRDK